MESWAKQTAARIIEQWLLEGDDDPSAGHLLSGDRSTHDLPSRDLSRLAARESSSSAAAIAASILPADECEHHGAGSDDNSSDQNANGHDAAVDDRALARLHASLADALSVHARQLTYDMAYGLSHELNNPLANIAARARLLIEDEPDESRRQALSNIVDQAMRGCEMIADLMLVARPPAMHRQAIDFSELLAQLCASAAPWLASRQLQLRQQLFDDRMADGMTGPCLVWGDRNALREAIWAVLRNAIEAARERVDVQLAYPTPHQREVCLTVRDDGPGLSDEALSRAFHPYYSGREAGRGLGLGLSKAQRLIEQMAGQVRLTNSCGGGCVVTITLPTHDDSTADKADAS